MKIETQVIIDKIDELLKEGHKPKRYFSLEFCGYSIGYIIASINDCLIASVRIHDVLIETDDAIKIGMYLRDIVHKNEKYEYDKQQQQNEIKVKQYFGI